MSKDEIKSKDIRIEIAGNGAVVPVSHDTVAELKSGLATWFTIDGKPVSLVGSVGPNQGEHSAPKKNPSLIPMPTDVKVIDGDSSFVIGGKPVATKESRVQVPDVTTPIKNNVIETSQHWFTVNGVAVVRGS